MPDAPKTLSLKHWYYRQYPCDYSRPEAAAVGYLGWAQERADVPANETALVLMHLWSHGFPGGLAWGPDAPHQAHVQYCEWVPRCVKCFTEKVPPIVDAARAAGVQIIHVASTENYAKKYPQYETTLAEVTEPEPTSPPGSIRNEAADKIIGGMWELKTGKGLSAQVAQHEYDFPPHLAPEGDDLVAVTTHQLNTLLRNRAIWHLAYCGFAINVCLWHSPCGMVDMKRLGYFVGCIRQGTVAVENHASARTGANHDYAMWWTGHSYGFVLDDEDFIDACQAAQEGGM